MIGMCIICLVLLRIGIKGLINVKKNINRIKKLSQNGTLIKGLKYRLVSSTRGNEKVQVGLKAIEVDYKLPSGKLITLVGDPRYDSKSCEKDSRVDLLIDLNNPDNYYIDFDIKG